MRWSCHRVSSLSTVLSLESDIEVLICIFLPEDPGFPGKNTQDLEYVYVYPRKHVSGAKSPNTPTKPASTACSCRCPKTLGPHAHTLVSNSVTHVWSEYTLKCMNRMICLDCMDCQATRCFCHCSPGCRHGKCVTLGCCFLYTRASNTAVTNLSLAGLIDRFREQRTMSNLHGSSRNHPCHTNHSLLV